ncbi:MAG: arginase [Proteobacteria bacterium]|nr:arginase [Pseudomonadota bacterium]
MSKKKIQIIGVPMDFGASRRGTDVGPSAMRVAGLGQELRRIGYKVLREVDIHVPAMETRDTKARKARFKAEILSVCVNLAVTVENSLKNGAIPVVIGGDHSIAMGTVAGVAGHYRNQDKSIGLIWFDAHGDMNIPSSSPSGNIHGMPLSHILGIGDEDLAGIGGFVGKVRPENVALVGIRDLDNRERKIIRDSGIHAYTMREIDERGMAVVAEEILKVVNKDTAGFHMSFDVDGCDPSVMPGSGTLVPGGISYREAHLLLEYCADSNRMTSMELVELNPLLDQANISAERAVRLVGSAFGKAIL